MSWLSKKTKYVSVLLATVLLATSVLAFPAQAVSQEEIDELQDELDKLEEEIAEQQKEVDKLTSQKSLIVDRKMAIDQKIELNQQQIRIITNQVELYNQMLDEKASELEEALAAEEEQEKQLRARMRAMEENSNLSYYSFLFEADGLTDLLSRMADINDIMKYDKALEEEYVALRQEAEVVRDSYEETLAEQELLQKELDTKQEELDAQIEAAYTMIANVSSLADDAEQEQAALAQKEAESEEEITKLLEEMAAEQAAAAASSGVSYSGYSSAISTSDLMWPVPSCSIITSTFGYRVAPTAGASTYHGGLDVGAQMGATIVAAAAGQVILAQYYGGYGNCIMIDHGNGIVTLYGHCQSIAVSYGQIVSQGQVIGYVGSTGVSTGPHLHYEVRVGGSQTDPAQYYSGLTYY